MVPRTTLITGRLRLEPVTPDHAKEMWAATESSLPELQRWMAWTRDPSFENTRTFTEFAEAEWDAGREYVFAVLEESRVVGTVGVHMRNPLDHAAELGYWVQSDRARRGLATEAARAVVNWAFQTLGLNRLSLMAGTENFASQQVALKLGFRREGSLRQAAWSATDPYDCVLFGLLAGDPRPSEDG